MDLLKIRLFGSSRCDRCLIIKQSLKYYDLPYDYIDIDDPKNDKLCDILNIDEIPVLQILNTSNNSVVRSHIGIIDPMKLLKSISSKKTIYNKEDGKNKGCKNCYD